MSVTPPNPYGIEPPFPRDGAHRPPGVDFHKHAVPPPPIVAYAGTGALGPVSPLRTRTSGLSAALGWAMLVTGVLIALAAALPWGHIRMVDGTTCLVRGFDDGNCGRYTDTDYDLGVLTIVLSVPVVVLGLLRGCIRARGMALGAAVACLVLGVLVTLLAAIAPSGPDGLPASAHFSIAYGTWLTLALGCALVIVSIWGIVRHR